MRKYNVNNKYIVKAKSYADAIKAVKKLTDTKLKDKYRHVDVGIADIVINDKHKAYDVGGLSYDISSWDEKGLRDFGKRVLESADFIKKLNASGYKKDGNQAYLNDSLKDTISVYQKIKDDKTERELEKLLEYTVADMIEKDGKGYKIYIDPSSAYGLPESKANAYVTREARKIEKILQKHGYQTDFDLYDPSVFAYKVKNTKDANDNDSDIEFLSNEEKQAIEDYKKAISNTKDPQLLKLFAHILNEEIEHLEELEAETIEDADEDANNVLRKYQEWVDYDMKHYHKISEETLSKLKKAGLEVVKDKYGDYEVIARG